MEDLKAGIESEIAGEETVDFLELSQKWAAFSLATFRDELLTKALQISKALAEFDCELKNPT